MEVCGLLVTRKQEERGEFSVLAPKYGLGSSRVVRFLQILGWSMAALVRARGSRKRAGAQELRRAQLQADRRVGATVGGCGAQTRLQASECGSTCVGTGGEARQRVREHSEHRLQRTCVAVKAKSSPV